MVQLPSGRWYEGANLGFNNRLIAAASSVNGNIVPWAAGAPVLGGIHLFFEIVSGASANFSVFANVFDINAQTQIVIQQSLWTAIAGDAVLFVSLGDGTVPLATSGTVNVNADSPVLGAPYLQFTVVNNDAVNPGNVTLRALLRP